MQKSFLMMQDLCLAQMRRPNDPTLREWTKFWLNEEFMDFVAHNDLPAFNHRFSVTVDTTVQSDLTTFQEVPAPCDIIKLYSAKIYDAVVSPPAHTPMKIIPLMEFERKFTGENPADGEPDTPLYIALRRLEGIRSATLGVAAFTVESSSTEDTGEVTFVGYADSLFQTQTKVVATLNGTSTVALGSFYEPISLSKEGATVGNIILKRATVSVVEILPWEVSAYHAVYQIYPYADQTYTLTGLYKRRPPLMSSNSDIPFGVPDNALEILIQGTVMKGLQVIEDGDWQVAKKLQDEEKINFLRSLRGIGEEQDYPRVEFG